MPLDKPPQLRTRTDNDLVDFFENAPLPLRRVGPDGRILWANRAELDMLGYSPEEYMGHHVAEFHVDQPVIEELLRRLTHRETVHDYEARLRCKDGSIKNVIISSTVLWEDGKFAHTRCFTRDITELKRAQETLCQVHEDLERQVRQRTADLENANEELKREGARRQRSESLQQGEKKALEMIASGAALPKVLAAIVRLIETQSDEMLCSILLLEDGTKLCHGAAPSLPDSYNQIIDGVPIGPKVGSCGTAAFRKEPVIVSDTATDPLWEDYRDLAQRFGLGACWSTPILSRTGDVLGTFAMYYRMPRHPTQEEFELIRIATHIAGIAIERSRDQTQLRSQLQRISALQEINLAINSTLELQPLLDIILERIALSIPHISSAGVRLFNSDTGKLECSAGRNIDLERWKKVAWKGQGLGTSVYESQQPLQILNVNMDPRSQNRAFFARHGIVSYLSLPLAARGAPLGILSLFTQQEHEFTREEIDFISAAANQAAIAIQNSLLFKQVKDQSEKLQRALVEAETAKHELELDMFKRKEIEHALRESEARKTAILQSALDCIVTIDHDGAVLDFNPAAERTFGYSSAQAARKELAGLIIPLRFRESHRQGLRRCLETDAARVLGKRIEMTALRADGTEFPVELSITRIDLEGSPIFTGYLRDITERKLAEESLRKAEEKYRSIFENATEGIFQSTPDGRFLTVNPALARMLGYDSPAELLAAVTNIEQQLYVEPKRRQELKQLLAEKGTLEKIDVQWYRKDRNTLWVSLNVRSVRQANGAIRHYEGRVEDITERKRAADERLRYASQLQALAESSLVINSALSVDEVVEIVTEKARAIIGAHQCRTSATMNQNLAHQAISDNYACYGTLAARPDGNDIGAPVCEANKPVRMTQAELEADPRWRHLQASKQRPAVGGWLAAPLIGRNGENIGLIQLADKYEGDFTAADEAVLSELAQVASVAIENARLFQEVRAGQERLQTLSRRLVQVQEAEKRQIARELHDEIGQSLTALKLMLEVHSRGRSRANPKGLDEAQSIVKDLMTRVRNMSLELRPAMLDDLGLLHALLWLIERYTTRTGLQVHFKHSGLKKRLPPDLETAAYRIAQEALTNVARHASVHEVSVRMTVTPAALSLQVRDRGRGFDLRAHRLATGGLEGMRERAALLGGKLVIKSSQNSGTNLTAVLPLAGNPPQESKRRRVKPARSNDLNSQGRSQ
ncbi:MAG: PAS domain S-box protein [Candidatus Binatia bacterium]